MLCYLTPHILHSACVSKKKIAPHSIFLLHFLLLYIFPKRAIIFDNFAVVRKIKSFLLRLESDSGSQTYVERRQSAVSQTINVRELSWTYFRLDSVPSRRQPGQFMCIICGTVSSSSRQLGETHAEIYIYIYMRASCKSVKKREEQKRFTRYSLHLPAVAKRSILLSAN